MTDFLTYSLTSSWSSWSKEADKSTRSQLRSRLHDKTSPPYSGITPPTPAKLAFLNPHISLRLAEVPYSPPSFSLSSKSYHRSRFSPTQLVSLTVLCIVLVVQLLRPSPVPIYSTIWDPEQENVRLQSEAVCENLNIFAEPLPVSRTYRMSLLEDARRVAQEFDYPAAEVNKGVKEFIREMSWCPCRRNSQEVKMLTIPIIQRRDWRITALN